MMGLIGSQLADRHAHGRWESDRRIRDAARGRADGPEPFALAALIKMFCCDCVSRSFGFDFCFPFLFLSLLFHPFFNCLFLPL